MHATLIMFEQPLKPDTPAEPKPSPEAGQSAGDLSDRTASPGPEDNPEIHPAPPPTDPAPTR